MKRLLYVIPLVLALGLTSTFPALADDQTDQSNLPPSSGSPPATSGSWTVSAAAWSWSRWRSVGVCPKASEVGE